MKKYFSLFLCIVVSIPVFSQFNKNFNVNPKHNYKVETISNAAIKLSPSLAIFLDKLTNEKSSQLDSLLDEYPIVNIDEQKYLKVFLTVENGVDFSSTGFIQGGDFGRIKTGIVSLSELKKLSLNPDIKNIQIASKAEPKLNEAIIDTRTDMAHNGTTLQQSYTGDGVVVGVIDVGFDYTHPSFYDSTGQVYRIKRVWEQASTSGTPPTGYTYGRELSGQTNIIAAQTDNNGESHGSHVAGTAAGSGAGTNDLYRGVAFESDIVLVGSDFTDLGIAEGVDYIIKYANSVNKPCVINMSLGKHSGPHDGTSPLDQVFDSLAGNGKLLVGAAGNEGSDSLFIGKNYSGNDTLMVSFINFPSSNLGTDGSGVVDIWGESGESFTVAVNIYNTNTDQVEDFTPYISSNAGGSFNYTIQDNDIFSDDMIVNIATEINPNNNKPHIVVEIDHTDQDDDFRWALIEIIGHNTSTKMWAIESYFTNNGYNVPFTQGSTSSTVGEIGGTSNSIITVGAYTTKNSYLNFNQSQQTIPFNVSIGEIAPFSSLGPTADNRTKPDITAPGNVIVAPVNSFDPNYATTNPEVVYGVTNGTDNWYYGAMQGTSMATPMVTGILALWLEANPGLSPSKALQVMKNNATTDGFTGNISSSGDNTWGWGKIDAFAGLVNIVGIGENKLNSSLLQVYPNPARDYVQINTIDNDGVTVFVSDMLGRIVVEPKLLLRGLNQLDLNRVNSGIYLMTFQKEGDSYTHKLIVED